MRLVLIGILLLLVGLWLAVLAYSQSGGRPARIGARRRDPSAADCTCKASVVDQHARRPTAIHQCGGRATVLGDLSTSLLASQADALCGVAARPRYCVTSGSRHSAMPSIYR